MPTRKRPPILALLLDISGTLQIGSSPTKNAVDAFHRLRQSSIPFRLCSNSSKESTAALITRLDKMGFGISGADTDIRNKVNDKVGQRRVVWTSIGAVAQMVRDMGLKKPLLLLTDSASQEVLDAIDGRQKAEGASSEQPSAHDAVVVGLAPSHFDYPSLNTAFRTLKGETTPAEIPSSSIAVIQQAGANQSQVPLIATHKAKYVQTESGLSLGPGPFVTALEHASGVTALVVGKPTKAFFHMVIQDFTTDELGADAVGPADDGGNSPRGRIAVIGDDVEADLGEGAIELGLWRVLVRTGKYRPGDENRPGIVPPDEISDSFAEFIDSLFSDDKSL
ncbi:HAD-like protein [Pholiota conissans]|uniref:HAD-like protein n=1 Tax=Pholiota conissans TaxID=109636 RepID=A0A9P5YZ60_9AGAR|nr:HAD-like protein [Pholiota conissans]